MLGVLILAVLLIAVGVAIAATGALIAQRHSGTGWRVLAAVMVLVGVLVVLAGIALPVFAGTDVSATGSQALAPLAIEKGE